MARGYAVFANGGFRITPWFIDEVKDRDGKTIFKEKPPTACRACMRHGWHADSRDVERRRRLRPRPGRSDPDAAPKKPEPASKQPQAPKPVAPPADTVLAPRAIDPRVAYQIVSMMRDVVQRGTGTAAKVLGREDVAGKTGSTNDYRDAWFSGLGGNLVTTVWVGRDDFRSLGYREYGGKAALPIWIDYMRVALKDVPIAANDPPDGMVKVSVAANGTLIPGGSGGITEYVKVEDLERMQSYTDYNTEDTPDEESFDIF